MTKVSTIIANNGSMLTRISHGKVSTSEAFGNQAIYEPNVVSSNAKEVFGKLARPGTGSKFFGDSRILCPAPGHSPNVTTTGRGFTSLNCTSKR